MKQGGRLSQNYQCSISVTVCIDGMPHNKRVQSSTPGAYRDFQFGIWLPTISFLTDIIKTIAQ